jgi:hypothetical protein
MPAPGGGLTRRFAVGELTFQVDAPHPDDRSVVEAMFQDLPTSTATEEVVHTINLKRSGPDGDARWTFSIGSSVGEPPRARVVALVRLMAWVNLRALDHEPEHLHLHAAAAVRDGRSVIIAADRQTGKTTTVAHLVKRGWQFVTDETVRLRRDDDVVSGFRKPLSIKPGGFDRVDHLRRFAIPDGVGGGVRFVSVGASGGAVSDGAPGALVILLRRPPETGRATQPIARSLHPADAVVGLMPHVLDARRYGAVAERLARLSAQCHSYELVAGSPEATADCIDTLWESLSKPASVSRELDPSSQVSDAVSTIAIGDRGVIYDARSGVILALDAAGMRLWERIGGWVSDRPIDPHHPDVARLAEQLSQLGIIDPGSR